MATPGGGDGMGWDGYGKSFGILVGDCREGGGVKIKAGRAVRVLPALPALPQERRAVQGARHEGRAALPPARARGGVGVETASYAAEFCAAAAQGLDDCPVATGRGDEGNHRRPD